MEVWKDIKGYEGYYKISSLGRVKSLDRVSVFNNKHAVCSRIQKGKIINHYINKGYACIRLYNEGRCRRFLLHRLLGIHFIPNQENKPCINHKNGIRHDFSLENLEWCTYKENSIHAFDTGLAKNKGLKGDKNGMYGRNYGENPRAKIVLDMSNGVFYSCAKEAAEINGIKPDTLRAMLQGVNPNKTTLKYV